MIIGIDVGLQGAVGWIDISGYNVSDTPTYTITDGKKIKTRYDLLKMLGLLKAIKTENCHAILEQAQAMPGQGVTSMFSIGVGFGLWQMALTSLEIPHTIISPQKWTRVMGTWGKANKEKNIEIAMRLFPKLEFTTPRGRKLDGRADAMLLAEYGRRIKS